MQELEARYFDALYEAAKAINSTLNPDEVLSIIVRATTEATDAKGCSVVLLDDERKHLVHRATYGLSDRYLRKGVIEADRSLADALKGEPVVVSDVSNDPRLQYPAEAVEEGIASMLSVPLVGRKVIVGVVRIYSSHRQEYSAETIKLATAIANLSAIAIENARMFGSLKEANQVCRRELAYWQP
jgi:GAF domain-containing protein